MKCKKACQTKWNPFIAPNVLSEHLLLANDSMTLSLSYLSVNIFVAFRIKYMFVFTRIIHAMIFRNNGILIPFSIHRVSPIDN